MIADHIRPIIAGKKPSDAEAIVRRHSGRILRDDRAELFAIFNDFSHILWLKPEHQKFEVPPDWEAGMGNTATVPAELSEVKLTPAKARRRRKDEA